MNASEVDKGVRLLKSQGYFSEYEVKLGLSVAGTQNSIDVALSSGGWSGTLIHHATDCDDESFIYSVFDPDQRSFEQVDVLIRREAAIQRKSRP